jgi:hypothetical protein
MSQFLVAVQLPAKFDPASETEATALAIDALNQEMADAGVVVFLGGLKSLGETKSLRAGAGGKVVTTDGPFLETKEHLGGFWVLEVADMEAALAWARKAVVACAKPIEVREFGAPPE